MILGNEIILNKDWFPDTESAICARATSAIFHHENEKLADILKDPDFDINERFGTSYSSIENYFNYAIFSRNYEAASMIFNFENTKTDTLNVQRIALADHDVMTIFTMLADNKKYLRLYKTFKALGSEMNIKDYVKSLIHYDYTVVYTKK